MNSSSRTGELIWNETAGVCYACGFLVLSDETSDLGEYEDGHAYDFLGEIQFNQQGLGFSVC